MLKKLAKRINKEMNMACDYMDQAMLLKYEDREMADAFVALASERADDIERMYRLGFNHIEQKKGNDNYSRSSTRETEDAEAKKLKYDEAKTIWDWEYRISNEKLQELKHKITNYKR